MMEHASPPKNSVPSELLKGITWPEESFSSTPDDLGGFYPLYVGEGFEESRFVVTRKLGWGRSSSVWLARDRKDERHVALKVLTSYATQEIEKKNSKEREILQLVTKAAPSHRGFAHVVHLLDEFRFESFIGPHICFVTNVLSFNIPAFQKHVGRKFTLPFAAKITREVLKGLEYLHDECKVVHSDLKPANILLRPIDTDFIVQRELSVDPAFMYTFPRQIPPNLLPFHPYKSQPLFPSWISGDVGVETMRGYVWVVADFSHSHIKDRPLDGVVQPYALRAPEVLLGLEWGPPIDIWSLGCLMFEFLTDQWLFVPEESNGLNRDLVHLAQMSVVTGEEYSEDLLEGLRNREDLPLKDSLRRAITENAVFGSLESRSIKFGMTVYGERSVAFIRLMKSFLSLDPSVRPCAAEALQDSILELNPF